jgi:hypothetical protein
MVQDPESDPDPDPESEPKLPQKSDLDLKKKIIWIHNPA